MWKKVDTLILIVLLFSSLAGCSKKNTYQPMQPYENISSIEIVDVRVCYSAEENSVFREITVTKAIKEECWEELWTDILALSCKQHFNDPPENIEGYAVRIVYNDGAYEMMDADTVSYSLADGETLFSFYYFEEEIFNSLISKWK